MIQRRFPTLTTIVNPGAHAFAGMLKFDSMDLSSIAIGDEPGIRAETRMRDMLEEFVDDCRQMATDGLDFDGVILGGTFVSFLPSRSGEGQQACCAWRGRGDLSYVSATMPLSHLATPGSCYAAYDGNGRIHTLRSAPEGW